MRPSPRSAPAMPIPLSSGDGLGQADAPGKEPRVDPVPFPHNEPQRDQHIIWGLFGNMLQPAEDLRCEAQKGFHVVDQVLDERFPQTLDQVS